MTVSVHRTRAHTVQGESHQTSEVAVARCAARLSVESQARLLVARLVVLRWLTVTRRAEARCPAPRSANTLLRSSSAAVDQLSVKHSAGCSQPRCGRCASQRRVARDCCGRPLSRAALADRHETSRGVLPSAT